MSGKVRMALFARIALSDSPFHCEADPAFFLGFLRRLADAKGMVY